MIEFECEFCQKLIRLKDDKAGRHGHCPHCQAQVTVPESSAFLMHDEVFFETTPHARNIGSPALKNADTYSKAAIWAGSALAWFFGILFFLFFLASVWRFPLASIPILLAAGILTPPIYERLRSLFKFDLDVQLKVVASLVLFVAYLVMYGIGTSNEASEQRRIAEQQAEQARQSERDETIRYLQANKQQIQASAYQLLDQGKVTEAFDAVRKFRGLGDSDIEAVIAKVEAKSKAIADEAKKAKLIESLATIKSDNISERARIYEELSALAPGNAEYKKMAADLKAQLAQAAIKKKAEADAAAAKAYQREMGLVWRYDSYKDEMTQKPILNAQVDSVSTLSFDFPYSGSQRATLQLRKHPRWGSDVILQIQRGQFLCNSYDGCSVYVRFGNGAPQRFSASQPSDNSTTYLFISGYSNFVSQLRKVDEVVIEASFFQAGNQAMKFSTSDLNWN